LWLEGADTRCGEGAAADALIGRGACARVGGAFIGGWERPDCDDRRDSGLLNDLL